MPTIPHILAQHAEEAAFLWLLRDAAVGAPHYDLKDLAELDQRVEAHIDGLRLAGDEGWEIIRAELAWEETGEVFAAAVLAFESNDAKRVDEVLEVAGGDAELARGAVSALGWITYEQARPQIETLLASDESALKRIGLAAAAVHRQGSGPALQQALQHEDVLLCARALKALGEFGATDLLPIAAAKSAHQDENVRFWAAWSAALLGDSLAADPLSAIAMTDSPQAERAADLAARRMPLKKALGWLKVLANDPARLRLAAKVAGAIGDPVVMPWLLDLMSDDEIARPAGEAFSMITGVDLAYDNLERDQPEEFEAGPTEDPADEEVALDADEDLPWPDQQLVAAWWQQNSANYNAGTRHLLGKPITSASLAEALATGQQRQRAAAALEQSLHQPGRPLFEVRAPGFRQRRTLVK